MTSGAESITLAELMRQLQGMGIARLDAQRLLLHLLGRDDGQRAWLFAHDQELAPASVVHALAAHVARLQAGEPLAYLLGQQAFYGLTLTVDARVLVPRPDSETLVDWALKVLSKAHQPVLRVLDLGTGSGALALAIQAHCPQAQVCATDLSPDALDVARTNGERLNLPVQWQQGAWFEALAPGTATFDVIVSNPPYIATHDPHLAALGHEPALALTSGPDGLEALRHLIAQAPEHLTSGGWLLLEHGFDQAPAVRALLSQAGFEFVQSRHDLAGIERCSGGQWRLP